MLVSNEVVFVVHPSSVNVSVLKDTCHVVKFADVAYRISFGVDFDHSGNSAILWVLRITTSPVGYQVIRKIVATKESTSCELAALEVGVYIASVSNDLRLKINALT